MNDDDIEHDDDLEFPEKMQELIDVCDNHNIEWEKDKDWEGDEYITVKMPCARNKRPIEFYDSEEITTIIKQKFYEFSFIDRYDAIVNYQTNKIEALLGPIGNRFGHISIRRKILDENQELLIEDPSSKIAIKISNASGLIRALTGAGRLSLSMSIERAPISNRNPPSDILKKISNSVLFQIESQLGQTLALGRHRTSRPRFQPNRAGQKFDLQFPQYEFDDGPISLYWYATSASGMPLLQFLAYYQVIEYYYPTYSQEEARKRVRTILKDPMFRADRDSDLGKLISATSGSSRGFGDERTQLRATINACLSPEELKEFYAQTSARKEFFSSKQKGLTDEKVTDAMKAVDIVNATAKIIYDIRCKIVHTKGEASNGEIELLLPFSKEADLLHHDIELIQFIARKVLIAASSKFECS